MLIAIGAVLAFAVSAQVAGIDIQTVGAILIVVGGIGLAISIATLAGYAPWAVARAGATPQPANVANAASVAPPTNVAPPTA
jgi:hypothetical protein